MINLTRGIKKYAPTITFLAFMISAAIFFAIDINSEQKHFSSDTHTELNSKDSQAQVKTQKSQFNNLKSQTSDQITPQNSQMPIKQQQIAANEIIMKQVNRGTIRVTVNSQWENKDGTHKIIYNSIFQGDPFQSWYKAPIMSQSQKRRQTIDDVKKHQYPFKPVSKQQQISQSHVKAKAGITVQQAIAAKQYKDLLNLPADSQLANKQRTYYEQKYAVSGFAELPFCIVIPSYMNVENQRYIKNMKSIIQQQYSNYHIVFIDDASEDLTGEKMRQWAQKQRISQEKLNIIVNTQRGMAMPNIYKAAKQNCKPYEIFIIVDGDDQLIGRQVFKHFNQIFSNRDVWLAYTNFLTPRGTIGYSRPYNVRTMQRNSYRKSAFVISHLRAFYTKLLTNIQIEDLQDDQGKWYRAANDVAMYLPILQQCHQRIIYVPEISYYYNSNTGLNNHRVKLKEQKGNQRKIKAKNSYQAVEQLFTPQQKQQLQKSLGMQIPLYKQ